MYKTSLLKRFTIFSFIAFVITGVSLGLLISNHIRNDMLDSLGDMTLFSLDTIVKPELTAIEYERPLPEHKILNMNSKFDEMSGIHNIIAVKIWNLKKEIIYSKGLNLSSTSKYDANGLSQALQNKTAAMITKSYEGEIQNYNTINEIIKIYVPITYNNKVVGVFEVYKSYDEIKMHINALNRIITYVMFFGLLILYLLLLKIIYDASKTLVLQNQSLHEQKEALELSYQKLNSSYKSTVITLSNAVDARDPYTAGHSERVSRLSLEIGQTLGLTEAQLDNLELSALFHDIGKLGVPDNVLLKPGKLSEKEFAEIKKHPVIGVNILKNIDFLSSTLPSILHHHEKFAGGGYPGDIKGEDIPLESRIISVADTYDAMTSDRPYRKGLPHNEAVSEITKLKGIQFDSSTVDAFIETQSKKTT